MAAFSEASDICAIGKLVKENLEGVFPCGGNNVGCHLMRPADDPSATGFLCLLLRFHRRISNSGCGANDDRPAHPIDWQGK